MLRCVIVNTVKLADGVEVCKTDCFGRQDLSCAYLAHHQLESDFVTNVVIIVTIIKPPPLPGPIPKSHFLIMHMCFNMHVPDQCFDVL